VVTGEGQQVPAGSVSLTAADVGPFLRATSEGETELSHLARSEGVWDAWLTAIGNVTTDDSVGAATTGIGPFLRQLADGDPVVETLDVASPDAGSGRPDDGPPLVPTPGFEEQIVEAVPYPRPPLFGRRRWSLKLLNGVDGKPISRDVMRTLILTGASLETLGNAEGFGRERTLIEYSDEAWEDAAKAAKEVLGDTAMIKQLSGRRAESEPEALIITLGEDALTYIDEQAAGDGEDDGG
jgi:hypothetical protein